MITESKLTYETLRPGTIRGLAAAIPLVYDDILDRIKLRARLRIAWLQKLWKEAAGSRNESKLADLHSEVDGYLNNQDSVYAEAVWYAKESNLSGWNEELKKTEARLAADTTSRLARLRSLFKLNDVEYDIIQTCLAQYIDPHLGRVYAYLHDHNNRGYTSCSLIARLFQHGSFIVLGSSSPLHTWGIIRENEMGRGEPARLELDPFIRNWLLGSDDLDPLLKGHAETQPVLSSLKYWPVNEWMKKIRQGLMHDTSGVLRVFIAGAEGTGRRSFTAALCAKLQYSLLSVHVPVAEQDWNTFYMRAQRQALLGSYVLLWNGSACMNFPWSFYPGISRLQFICGEADEAPAGANHFIDLRVNLPEMDIDEATRLYKKLIPVSQCWPEDELQAILRKHHVNIGQIVQASEKNITSIESASEVLRSSSRHRLGELAKQINSSFSWSDLVVGPVLRRMLNDFFFEATERHLVWEQDAVRRLFPQGSGLMALFTGPPGTGKTMAAQVIANHLQLDLFRIDLSAMVSKYIGETSKNIQRILTRAQRMNVVLLFDEADALFGKRTELRDAHDRYANTDTNYLLQAIEDYPGIAILASNKKSNIDTAFSRRLRYVIEFPRPDALQRKQLWNNLIAELAGQDQASCLQSDIEKLSGLVDVTGAQIKLVVLSALYMSRQLKSSIHTGHLLAGLERELSKDGRGLGKQVQDMFRDYLTGR